MNFKYTPIAWENKGIEPTANIKKSGFLAGYRPPAEYHNFMFANGFDCIGELQTSLKSHAENVSNPHSVTKSQVSLGNVDNIQQASKVEFNNHVNNNANPHGVTKSQIGLGNATNESKSTMFTNPIFTGVPKAPTASTGTSTEQIATTEFVNLAFKCFMSNTFSILKEGLTDITSFQGGYEDEWNYLTPSKVASNTWYYMKAGAPSSYPICWEGDCYLTLDYTTGKEATWSSGDDLLIFIDYIKSGTSRIFIIKSNVTWADCLFKRL